MAPISQKPTEQPSQSPFNEMIELLKLVETYLRTSKDDLSLVKKFLSKKDKTELDKITNSLEREMNYVSNLWKNLPKKLDEGDQIAIQEAERERLRIILEQRNQNVPASR